MVWCYNCLLKQVADDATQCPACGAPFPYVQKVDPCKQRPLSPGTVLQGKYLIGKCLGIGGNGITYLVRDTSLGLRLTIKEFFPNRNYTRNPDKSITCQNENSPEVKNAKLRFRQELLAMGEVSRLHIPNTVQVYNSFLENGTEYIVMEFVDGVTLKKVLDKRKLSYQEAVKVAVVVLETLDKLHKAEILHRDVSPDNIMCLPDNAGYSLIDYGNSTWINNQAEMPAQHKQRYTPQEQYFNQRQGPYTDVYSVAATIFRSVAGGLPDSKTTTIKHGQTLPKLSFHAPSANVPPDLDALLIRASQTNAADRIQSAEAFRQELLLFLDDKKTVPKKTIFLSLAALVLAGGVGLILLSSGDKNGDPPSAAVLSDPPIGYTETLSLTAAPAALNTPFVAEETALPLPVETELPPTDTPAPTFTPLPTATPTPEPPQFTVISLSPSFTGLVNDLGYLKPESTYAVTGIATPHKKLVLIINGASYAWSSAEADGSFMLTLDPIMFDTATLNTLKVAYEDPAADNSSSTYITFIYKAEIADIVLDTLPTTDHTSLLGQIEPGASVTLQNGGTPVQTVTCSNTGSFIFDNLTLKENDILTLTATDLAGNSRSVQYTVVLPKKNYASICLDSTLSDNINENGYLKARDTHIISGTASPNEELIIQVDNTIVQQTVTTDNMGHFSFNLSDEYFHSDSTITLQLEYANIEPDQLGFHTGSLAFLYKNTMQDIQLSLPPQEGENSVSGSAEPNSTITITAGSTALHVIADANGHFKVEDNAFLSLHEGDTVSFRATDIAGNTTDAQVVTLAAKIIYTPIKATFENLYNNYASPARETWLSGQATPECMLVVFVNDHMKTVTSDAKGAYRLLIDPAWMLDSEENTVSIQYESPDALEYGDTSASAFFLYRKPIENLSITGTVREGVTVVSGVTEASTSVKLTINGKNAKEATSSKEGSYSFTIPALKKDDQVLVEATDQAGNTVSVSALAPAMHPIKILSTDPKKIDAVFSNLSAKTLTFTLQLQAEQDVVAFLNDQAVETRTVTGNAGELTEAVFKVDVSKLKHGSENTVSFAYKDGKKQAATAFTIDAKCTEITLNAELTGDSQQIEGKTEKNAEVSVKVNTGTTYNTKADQNGAFTLFTGKLAEDSLFTITAKDPYGNSSVLTGTVSPGKRKNISITSKSQTIGVSGGMYNVSGTATGGEKIIVQLTQDKKVILEQQVLVAQKGSWSVNIDPSSLSGDYKLSARYKDERFSYAASKSINIAVDNHCVGFTKLSPDVIDTDTVSLSGKTESGATVQLFINGNGNKSATADSDGKFTLQLPTLRAGQTVKLVATDIYQNSTTSKEWTVKQAALKYTGQIERPSAKSNALTARGNDLQLSYLAWAAGTEDTTYKLSLYTASGQHLTDMPAEAMTEKDLAKYKTEYADVNIQTGWEFRSRYMIKNPSESSFLLKLIAERNGKEEVLQEVSFSSKEETADEPQANSFDFLSANLDYAVGIDTALLSMPQPAKKVLLTGWFYAPKNSTVTYSFIIDGTEYSTSNAMRTLGGTPQYTSIKRTVFPNPTISSITLLYDNIDTAKAGRTITLNLSKLEEGKHTVIIKQTITLSTTNVTFNCITPPFTLVLDNTAPALNLNSYTRDWN